MYQHLDFLEKLYGKYNFRSWAKLDPVHFLYRYRDPADIEVTAVVASCFAYGRVEHILKTVEHILSPMGDSPAKFVVDTPPAKLFKIYPDFKHRFQTSSELAALLSGLRKVIKRHGSLEKAFADNYNPADETIVPALTAWRNEIYASAAGECGHLLPDVTKNSACKRLFMLMRWMVRKDAVDVGIWKKIPQEKLVLPLDVHLNRWCAVLGLTSSKTPSLRAAVQASSEFKKISPDDPVKYDFALAHEGMESVRGRL